MGGRGVGQPISKKSQVQKSPNPARGWGDGSSPLWTNSQVSLLFRLESFPFSINLYFLQTFLKTFINLVILHLSFVTIQIYFGITRKEKTSYGNFHQKFIQPPN